VLNGSDVVAERIVLGESGLVFVCQRSTSAPGVLKPEIGLTADMDAVAEVLGESKAIESPGTLSDGPDMSIAGEG